MRLLTIDDLADPSNDWRPLLDHVSMLRSVYDTYKKSNRRRRVVEVCMTGDEDRPPGLHASELNTCLRQAAYSLNGTKKSADTKNVNVNMLMRFDVGSAVHAILQDDFHRMCMDTNGRLTFSDEVRIDRSTHPLAAEYDVASSTDGIFTFYDESYRPYLRIGIEIKTMSAKEFDKITEPKSEHVMQATLYQKMLDVPLMWFVYYNKSNSNITMSSMPWVLPFNKNIWNRIESRMQQVHTLVGQDTLPDREEGMHCTWCPYARTCEPAYTVIASKYATPSPKARKLIK